MTPDKSHKTNETIRCFIAIVLDGQMKRQIGQIQTAIRSSGIDARWPSAQNFHLTLKFLGNISQQALPCIKAILSEAIADKSRFNITFNRLINPGPSDKKPASFVRGCPLVFILWQSEIETSFIFPALKIATQDTFPEATPLQP
ncbi:2'-5' RNA ligase family protein [Desulfobacter postgatei]|uniref:2',5' RNA ligase family protein n=1 Tax=Desulfobacter postgatei 2ac9 TaxID=879212 RepID=I5AY80_9BACT|nr:2'-5' RNA ligase family protein [Desulfobacter postgatei]EIM62193.1 2',5' RNA ligase family protein [Desulfobacter postgatei 2ac9]